MLKDGNIFLVEALALVLLDKRLLTIWSHLRHDLIHHLLTIFDIVRLSDLHTSESLCALVKIRLLHRKLSGFFVEFIVLFAQYFTDRGKLEAL